MKVAVIIHHPFRDNDYRVDIVDVEEQTPEGDIRRVIDRKMLGPFRILALTTKVSERDIKPGLEEMYREVENHIES